MSIEDIFSSKPRVRILLLIYTLGSLNVSDVARRLKMNYTMTARHLRILEAEGILQVHVYGRVKMYRFKEGSIRAKAIADMIEAWEKNS